MTGSPFSSGALGAIALLLPLAFAGCSVDLNLQGGGAASLSVVPELPAELEFDRPLLAIDLAEDRRTAHRILRLEDARAPDRRAVEELAGHLDHRGPGLRRMAVRALGRLERTALLPVVARALNDPDPAVRVEAANALAQSARGRGNEEGPGLAGDEGADEGGGEGEEATRTALDVLHRALETESDPRVQGALARALGRIPLAPGAGPDDLTQRVERLAALVEARADDPHLDVDDLHLGVARGALFLARGVGGSLRATPEGTQALAHLAALAEALALDPAAAPAVRRAATAARRASGPLDPELAARLLDDPDPEVRRLAAEGAAAPGRDTTDPAWRAVVLAALSDPYPTVRTEGVRGWARHHAGAEGCANLVEGARDPADPVALAALQALGEVACGAGEAGELARVADRLPSDPLAWPSWHRPVRALQALARIEARGALVDPTAEAALARGREAMAAHEDPFVRAHLARNEPLASGLPGELHLALARDPDPNVREAALPGVLAGVFSGASSGAGPGTPPPAPPLVTPGEGRDLLVSALELDDPQLIRTVVRLLEEGEVDDPGPVREALQAALERFERQGRSTDHDARVALRRGLLAMDDARGAVPDAGPGSPPSPSLDPDAPRPTGEDNLPLPSWEELVALERGHLVLVFEGGGLREPAEVRIQLLPFQAPTNAARTAELARSGAFVGRTLHRVVPNFVVQGGSPGANEYAGHGAWTRDELGVPGHWKGTVGVSTRGRDTGDGQLFVNLVDNLRLDHDYTVFGVVVDGWPALSQLQEGVRIREARFEETDPDRARPEGAGGEEAGDRPDDEGSGEAP